jgi:hypothetical protein
VRERERPFGSFEALVEEGVEHRHDPILFDRNQTLIPNSAQKKKKIESLVIEEETESDNSNRRGSGG